MLPEPSVVDRRAAYARMLQGLAAGSQVAAMVVLFLLWKQFNVPFWTAVEWCVVAGVSVYTALVTTAAFLLTLARLQPIALLFAQLSRLASVGIFAALRYVHGMSLPASAATWALIYLTAGFMVRRIRRRAARHLGVQPGYERMAMF